MLFDKSNDVTNERILYSAKPNILFGCKKAIFAAVLLAIVLMFSSMAIKFVGKMQVYLISQIHLPLTRYAAIGFFVVILCIIIYIIWQLLGWYSTEYALTDTKVVVKSGLISTKKNYMPYVRIQDINTSQSFIARLFSIGSISLFSAYDNNMIVLSNISNPSKVEEIIFSNMVNYGGASAPPNRFPRADQYIERDFQQDNYLRRDGQHFERDYPPVNDYRGRDTPQFERDFQSSDEYLGRNDYYDEFEPITPIGREKDNPPRREYEYYPEDLGYNDERHKRYDYEPYHDKSIRYEAAPGSYQSDSYQSNRAGDDYSYDDREEHYQSNGPEIYDEDVSQPEPMDGEEQSSETAIKRHFDKFKR